MYTEDQTTFPSVTTRPLHDCDGWLEFVQDTSHVRPEGFIFELTKFGHKVFAQLDAFENSDERYIVWLDADVVIHKDFTERDIVNLLDGEMCAFLGRQESYTETGFIAFDTHHPDFSVFKERYADYYRKRHIVLLPYWIDCLAFDASKHELSQTNLTPGGKGMQDVFSISPLSEYMSHDKGERKYQR